MMNPFCDRFAKVSYSAVGQIKIVTLLNGLNPDKLGEIHWHCDFWFYKGSIQWKQVKFKCYRYTVFTDGIV